jgi:hypothetical protein
MHVAGIPKTIQDLRPSLRLRGLQLRVVFAGAEVRTSQVSDTGPVLTDRDAKVLWTRRPSWTM